MGALRERGSVPPGLIYGVVAVVVLAIGAGIYLTRSSGSEQPIPTVTSPTPSDEASGTPSEPSPTQSGSAPAASDGRIEGNWNLTFRVRSSSVSSLRGGSTAAVSQMDPRCANGPCVTVMHSKPTVVLHQSGAKYAGSAAPEDSATCDGSPTSSRISLVLHVQRADAEGLATRVAGTAKQSGRAADGCPAFSVTYAVTALPSPKKPTSPSWPTVPQTLTSASSSTGNSNTGGSTGNTGNTGDTSNTGNTGNSGNSGNYGNG